MRFIRSRDVALTGLAVLLALGANAVPTTVTGVDTPTCDSLTVPTLVDELGAGAFPIGEQISTYSYGVPSPIVACAATENPLIGNVRVGISNFNAIAFTDVWYVANPGTSFTNVDGTVNGMIAFKIDTAGANVSLVSESGLADGIFAPGETWEFIIQDYTNGLGIPAHSIFTIGVPDAGTASSGNIIATTVPEPGTAALIGLGLAALAARRRARS